MMERIRIGIPKDGLGNRQRGRKQYRMLIIKNRAKEITNNKALRKSRMSSLYHHLLGIVPHL